jgi:steroid 5-alpha reductase family enzyme
MVVLHLEALAGIALSLSILMAISWLVQQRTGNSGWVAGISDDPRNAAFAKEWGVDSARTSAFFPLPPQKGAVP